MPLFLCILSAVQNLGIPTGHHRANTINNFSDNISPFQGFDFFPFLTADFVRRYDIRPLRVVDPLGSFILRYKNPDGPEALLDIQGPDIVGTGQEPIDNFYALTLKCRWPRGFQKGAILIWDRSDAYSLFIFTFIIFMSYITDGI